SRSALLVHALADAPELLLEATEDRLHQDRRAPSMPESVELMRVLRRDGHPSVVSGAGPAVLVMAGRRAELAPLVRRFVRAPSAGLVAEVALRTLGSAPVIGCSCAQAQSQAAVACSRSLRMLCAELGFPMCSLIEGPAR